jgi:hypothetical protein
MEGKTELPALDDTPCLWLSPQPRHPHRIPHQLHGMYPNLLLTFNTQLRHSILPIEVAGDLSHTVRIDCFDISADQYPPKDLIPKNIHLYVHDAFTPFPEEFQDQYDIVNIRFFAPVMNSSKVSPLLQNFLKITSKSIHMISVFHSTDTSFPQSQAVTSSGLSQIWLSRKLMHRLPTYQRVQLRN